MSAPDIYTVPRVCARQDCREPFVNGVCPACGGTVPECQLCNKPAFPGLDGYKLYCGPVCVQAAMKIQPASASATATATASAAPRCKRHGCTRAACPNGNSFYDYCGRTCRDRSAKTVAKMCEPLCGKPDCGYLPYEDPQTGLLSVACGLNHLDWCKKNNVKCPRHCPKEFHACPKPSGSPCY